MIMYQQAKRREKEKEKEKEEEEEGEDDDVMEELNESVIDQITFRIQQQGVRKERERREREIVLLND